MLKTPYLLVRDIDTCNTIITWVNQWEHMLNWQANRIEPCVAIRQRV